MPKRTAEAIESVSSKAAATGQDTARQPAADDEMGAFEDRWEDEVESEEEVDDQGENGEDGNSRHPSVGTFLLT